VQLTGIIISATTFIIIGLLHVAVIKVEYHLGARYWPAFALAGVALVGASFVVSSPLISGVLGTAGFRGLVSPGADQAEGKGREGLVS
jgi:hypothetical protein